jgi:hypothetical protein
MAGSYKERGHEAWALRLLAEVEARRERPDVAAAGTAYERAVGLTTELAMRPSSPTATSASASSTAARTGASRPGSISSLRRRCTATWA